MSSDRPSMPATAADEDDSTGRTSLVPRTVVASSDFAQSHTCETSLSLSASACGTPPNAIATYGKLPTTYRKFTKHELSVGRRSGDRHTTTTRVCYNSGFFAIHPHARLTPSDDDDAQHQVERERTSFALSRLCRLGVFHALFQRIHRSNETLDTHDITRGQPTERRR